MKEINPSAVLCLLCMVAFPILATSGCCNDPKKSHHGYYKDKCDDPHCEMCRPERYQTTEEAEPEEPVYRFAQGDRVEHFLLGPAMISVCKERGVQPGFGQYRIEYKDIAGHIQKHTVWEHELKLMKPISEFIPKPQPKIADDIESLAAESEQIADRILKRLQDDKSLLNSAIEELQGEREIVVLVEENSGSQPNSVGEYRWEQNPDRHGVGEPAKELEELMVDRIEARVLEKLHAEE